MNLKKKVLINQILPDTLFKIKKFLALNQNRNSF